jgi:transcriptional regulator GlxA family with amidase domain
MRIGIWGITVISLVVSLALGGDAALAEAERTRPYTRNVAIVIWNGAEILDWAGPTEVFAAAGNIAAHDGAPAFHVYTVSKTKDPIVTQGFVRVQPDYAIADAPKPDIVLFPGGGSDVVTGDPTFLEWAKGTASQAEIAVSVCTGAFILAKAGLLDGKEATTWYGMLDKFEKDFPKVRVRRGNRFVDNGKIVTTAGVSAGIDGSLHVVARLLGSQVAGETAQYMEYRWTPEAYLSNSYTYQNPSLDSRATQAK